MAEGRKQPVERVRALYGAPAAVKVLAMRARSERSPGRSSTSTRQLRCGRALVLAMCVLPLSALMPAGARAATSAGVTSATVHTATAPPPAGVPYEEESPEAFEGQLRAGDIKEAEFNKVAHHLHLLLRDGHHALVDYEGHQEPALQAKLLAVGIPVTIEYTPKAKSTHHTLRYVAAGILVFVLIVLAVLLVARRRRLAQLEEQPGAGGQSTSPGSE